MNVDLRQDFKAIHKHITERVRDYPVYVNAGPGEDDDPISQITCGFQFDQAGWIALVFDTRPKAEPDGEWNAYIEENVVAFDHWYEAFNDLINNGSILTLILPDGKKKDV